jgi:hypothetical protein
MTTLLTYLKSVIPAKFPAREIWTNGNRFWCFDYNADEKNTHITLTDGVYNDGIISFESVEKVCADVDTYLNEEIAHKSSQGYNCVSMQLFV